MSWLPINFAIIRNPINWAIVILMLIFAIFIAEAVAQLSGKKNGNCGCSH